MDPTSMSDMLSVFFDEGETETWDGSCFDDDDEVGESAAASSDGGPAESRAFWEAQHQLLQEALDRCSSTERRIRADTEEALQRLQSLGTGCSCSNRAMKERCRDCFLTGLTGRLRDAGYNSALCKSKWRSSPDIPSGEHSYIDVVIEAKDGKRSPVRVVIELSFRAEFEMARGSAEYNGLVGCLPEIFVGKSEKLRSVVKIMCGAAKKCMKDNKMHMAPWRKHKYMQSKWLGTCDRMPGAPLVPVATRISDRQTKPRASMLTFDFGRTVVEVV